MAVVQDQSSPLLLSRGCRLCVKRKPLALATGSCHHKALEEAGIRHVSYESPGTAREWLTWRWCLHEFAPLLFRGIGD